MTPRVKVLRLPAYRLRYNGSPYADLCSVEDAILTAESLAGRSIDWSCDPDRPGTIWADCREHTFIVAIIPWEERTAPGVAIPSGIVQA